MRILTINRPPYEKGAHIGGDEVQRKMLAKHLPEDVQIIHNHDYYEWGSMDFDIVHAFNITLNECVTALEIAQTRNIPLVVQSIFPPGIYCSGVENVRQVAQEATLLLANLRRDPDDMAECLGISLTELKDKTVFVPTGAPADWYLPSLHLKAPLTKYVLLAARYEDRKGQDKFLQHYLDAKLPYDLYLIGDHRHPVYGRCQELARGYKHIHVLPPIPHEELKHWFGNAIVSVLPTHYDNPGLVNLEAGITGCEVVTSNIPAIREYLEDYAWYGEVGNLESYVKVVQQAWDTCAARGFTRNTNIAKHIKDNYTWDIAGDALYRAYQRAIVDYKK